MLLCQGNYHSWKPEIVDRSRMDLTLQVPPKKTQPTGVSGPSVIANDTGEGVGED